MVQFLSINFFSWISSIFVGFFKSSHFFVSLFIYICLHYYCINTSKIIVFQQVMLKGSLYENKNEM